jgi:hypothetical protein
MSAYAIELYFHDILPKRAAIVIRIWGAAGAAIASSAPVNNASNSGEPTPIDTSACPPAS